MTKSSIIVPSKSQPLFNAHAKFAGRYKLTVRNSEGHITRETPWFENLITNNGLDLIWLATGTPKVFGQYCFVGTGSATPAFTDTTLQALLATTPNTGALGAAYVAGPPPYWTQGITYRFGTGVAAGNLSEIGIGVASNNLFSRSLIKDAFGNPTTITVLSTEVLDVTYEFRVYPPTADYTFSILHNGVTRSVNARTYLIQNAVSGLIYGIPGGSAVPFPEPMLSSTGQPDIYGAGATFATYGGGGAPIGGAVVHTYVVGSYEINIDVAWTLATANGTENRLWFMEWPHGRMSFYLSANAPKTNVQQMRLTYKISWARYP